MTTTPIVPNVPSYDTIQQQLDAEQEALAEAILADDNADDDQQAANVKAGAKATTLKISPKTAEALSPMAAATPQKPSAVSPSQQQQRHSHQHKVKGLQNIDKQV